MLSRCSPYYTCWRRRNRAAAPRQSTGKARVMGREGASCGQRPFLHPGTSGSLRWHPSRVLGWGWQKQQERCRLGSEWEAQIGISWCQPLRIKPLMSQKGGLVYLILSGGRTLIYAALGSPLPCRFTRRFSMRAASLTEIKGSPQSPRYYAQMYKSGLNI